MSSAFYQYPISQRVGATGLWLDTSNEGHYYDEALAEELTVMFSGSTVVDFGCGKGKYVDRFRASGIDCEGYDGNPWTPTLTGGRCHTKDLADPVDLKRVFDWVLSLEVGEHIPEQCEYSFIGNVHRHNREGVVLSWAIPGQGGRAHCNERENAYIKNMFFCLGYENDRKQEGLLRARSTLPWFRNTLMVLRRRRRTGLLDARGTA